VDHGRFDGLTRSLGVTTSRRTLGRALASGGLGALVVSAFGALRLMEPAEARNKTGKKRKKRKGKNKKRKQNSRLGFNQYGCVEVGQPCKGDSALCCSGICQGAAPKKGKPDTSLCVAHGTGTCDQAQPGLCEAANPGQTVCNNSPTCTCLRTTAGSQFCGENSFPVSGCAACQRDKDCEALGFAPGSACAPFANGNCAGNCVSGMVCMAPCGTI